VQKLLGLDVRSNDGDLVATIGGELTSMEAKPIAVLTPRRGIVQIL
jgi:hypothetical protein